MSRCPLLCMGRAARTAESRCSRTLASWQGAKGRGGAQCKLGQLHWLQQELSLHHPHPRPGSTWASGLMQSNTLLARLWSLPGRMAWFCGVKAGLLPIERWAHSIGQQGQGGDELMVRQRAAVASGRASRQQGDVRLAR